MKFVAYQNLIVAVSNKPPLLKGAYNYSFQQSKLELTRGKHSWLQTRRGGRVIP